MCGNTITLTVTTLGLLPDASNKLRLAVEPLLSVGHASLVPRLLCVSGEKRTWYTLFAHAQFPQDFWEFGSFHKICSVTLTFARHADFSSYK